ncbi:S1 family peptidase [Segatella copri]|jgi:hypothetical protein|nr:serine protease [Segatella copri]MCW4087368.1 serine protease [Segatella copri]MCW4160501.1 serine protease [Segatella copri]
MEKLVVMVGLKQPGNNIQLLGSCFAVPKNGYFVTCRHVIGDHTDNLVLVSSVDSNNIHEYQDTSKNQCRILDVQSIECVNPLCDLVVLKTAHLRIDSCPIGSLDELQVGDDVEIIGYPHCVNDWQMHILTVQKTMVGAKILRASQGIKYKYAILNVQTRPGQSGSMVFCPRLQKIIGILVGGYAPASGIMLAGINPHELNQTSFCLSAEYINEMLEE